VRLVRLDVQDVSVREGPSLHVSCLPGLLVCRCVFFVRAPLLQQLPRHLSRGCVAANEISTRFARITGMDASTASPAVTAPLALAVASTSRRSAKRKAEEPAGGVTKVTAGGVAKVTAVPAVPVCPITYEPIEHPVRTKYGHVFERDALLTWVLMHGTCPLTRQPLCMADIVSLLEKGAIAKNPIVVTEEEGEIVDLTGIDDDDNDNEHEP
jgi:hypothetical protein